MEAIWEEDTEEEIWEEVAQTTISIPSVIEYFMQIRHSLRSGYGGGDMGGMGGGGFGGMGGGFGGGMGGGMGGMMGGGGMPMNGYGTNQGKLLNIVFSSRLRDN